MKAQLTRGSLLVAGPDIDAGIYFRAVILLCDHHAAGSFGLLINRPLDFEVPEEIINTKNIVNPQVQLRTGGPLQPHQILLLHSQALKGETTLKVCEGVYLGGDLQFLQQALVQETGPSLRLCFGFCGWGPGELEQEILSGLWFLQHASAKAIFTTPAPDLWRSTLKEMGGKYAALSTIPDDLSLN